MGIKNTALPILLGQVLLEPLMRPRLLALAWSIVTVLSLSPAFTLQSQAADDKDQVLFNFDDEAILKDWTPVKLPEVEKEQPAPRIEIVPAPKARDEAGPASKWLKITFDGGDWPAIGTTKIPVSGNWRQFQTLKAELTVDRPSVAHFRVYQGKPDDKPPPPRWEKTMTLLPGGNDVTLLIRHGIGSMDAGKGDVTAFTIGMFQPEKGQTLLVGNVRLSPDWPAPKFLGWYSPYNHDGYSAAAARDYARTGTIPKFKVLGTDREVADLPDLAQRLKDQGAKPEPRTIEQVEAEFQSGYDKIKKDHPKAVLAILRQGEKGFDRSNADKVYEGWKYVYLNCHGPSGPNPGRETTPGPAETAEAFMRHRSVLLRTDLASIPKDAHILAAKLVVTRAGAADLKVPEKPNLWVAEPCNRDWDEATANCYHYARGKHWKGVSGLYYGEDPDFWPVFLAYGPAGGGAVSVWDFTEGVKFWQDGTHANHGFFLYGDANDYMRMYTPKARNLKQRPALLVVYEPKP
jgi:hypothetical protein